MTTQLRLLAVALLCLGGLKARGDDRPNILLIVSEDNGPELSCYGEPAVQTPILDRLAADGIRFQNAFVPQSGCSQSRAAYLTGLYPHQNGQIGLASWKFRMYRETPNLIRSLKSAGYRTGLIGKLHVNPASEFPFDAHELEHPNFRRTNLSRYTAAAERFFAAGAEPFFLSVNYPDAHRPFLRQIDGLPSRPLTGADVAPLRYVGLDTPQLREDTANVYNCMSRLDSLIGELLSALERSGKADRTLIVYFGDHGADLLRGKRTCYEGGLRVPLILRWPGRIPGGQVRQELVSTLDLFPTLLEVTGLPRRDELPGRSLAPLWQTASPRWRRRLYSEYHLHSAHDYYPQRAVRDGRFKLIQNLLPGEEHPGYRYTVAAFYPNLEAELASADACVQAAYARMRRPPEFELYDLETDPYEFTDLSGDPAHAATLADLQQALLRWRTRTNDPFLDARNLRALQAEVAACFADGVPQKSRLRLTYPETFFSR